MTKKTQKASISLFAGGATFALLVILSAIFFVYYFVELIDEIQLAGEVVSLRKWIFVLPGVCIAGGMLSYIALYESVTGKPSSKKMGRLFSWGTLLSLGLIFILPLSAERMTESYLEPLDYGICHGASYQWLYVQTIVYTRSPERCDALTLQRKGKAGYGS